VYDDTIEINFYNAAQNDFINIRDLTRWVGISGNNIPDGFQASKLISCMLKAANPDIVEFPPGIAYVQDFKISVKDSGFINANVPAANRGCIGLLEGKRLITSLTLGIANSWTNLSTITALMTFYRPPVLPEWSEAARDTAKIDILEKDFMYAANLCKKYIYGQNTEFKVLNDIENKRNDIIYKF
jgi:hypothetical protein